MAAYRLLRSRLSQPPELVVVGRPGWAYGDALELLQSQAGVRFLGHVSDPLLAELYRAAACLAFPSLYEGFGLPLLDALAARLPALIGGSGALPELAAGAALEVDAESVEAIADGLQRLLEDAQLRSQLAARGGRRARAFSWKASAALTLRAMEATARVG
jgi:glycosyltransferase involved in cell wall biosynthesis